MYTRAGATITISWTFNISQQDISKFTRVEIGVWRRWEPRPKLITVLNNGMVHPNPNMKSEAPAYYSHIVWNGNLKKGISSFEIKNVTHEHQDIYGFFLRKLWLSSAERLAVAGKRLNRTDDFLLAAENCELLIV